MDSTVDDHRAVLAALDRVLATPDYARLPIAVLDAARLLVAADSIVLTAGGTQTTYRAMPDTARGARIATSDRPALPVRRSVLRQVNGEHVLATTFRMPDGRAACLALVRARTDFSDREAARIDALSTRLSSLARFSAAGGRACRPAPAARRLTPSEHRVLACVAAGLTDRAAARRLGVAEATVRKHLEHSYRKLGVTNRVAATVSWLAGERQPGRLGR